MTETQPRTRHLGYARVSTYGQTLDAHLAQLKAQRCSKIYREKASGAQTDQRELLKLLKAIAPGDVVIVARSTFDLFAIVKQIVDAGGQFRSLAEPWADTATSTGRLMIAVLGGLAGVERDLIKTLTAEGRNRAKMPQQKMAREEVLAVHSRFNGAIVILLSPRHEGGRKHGTWRGASTRSHLTRKREEKQRTYWHTG